MHFDDRLDTVLRQPVRGREIARVQYVQLLDLLGKSSATAASALLDTAYARLSALAGELTAPDRARLLGSSGLKLRNPALVAYLAEDDPAVASAAIAAAQLEESEWLDLVPALPLQARGLLRHRRDLGAAVEMRLERLGVHDRGLPPARNSMAAVARSKVRASPAPVTKPAAARAVAERQGDSSIGELVRRIESFRKARSAAPASASSDSPRLPLGDADLAPAQPVRRFDFVTDAAGRIVHADPGVAPMVAGIALAATQSRRVLGAAPSPAEALKLRQPIEGQVLVLEGAPAIAGDWRVDAAPLFDAATGRYTGHAGRARRLAVVGEGSAGTSAASDRMRQILHELRNPAGAIQMASELIQQQIAGAVSHEYRSLAATIASDSASVLGGLDELDRLVKFDANVSTLEQGESDLAACIGETAALLERHMVQRESGYALDLPAAALSVAVARDDLDRLVWRLLAVIAGAAGPGEVLALSLAAHGDTARLELALPASLRELSDEELFAAQANARGPALSAGMFGLGFTLRLAAAEARSAGGGLRREHEALVVELPTREAASAKIRGG